MKVLCPVCKTAYTLPEDRQGEGGNGFVCEKCRTAQAMEERAGKEGPVTPEPSIEKSPSIMSMGLKDGPARTVSPWVSLWPA